MGIVRKTKSLDMVVKIFKQRKTAITAVDLIKSTKTKINKTTIYRILERMEAEGIIHSFNDNNGLRWYAKCKDCTSHRHSDLHPHFKCNNCGNIECLSVNVTIPKLEHFQIHSTQVMLTGTCKNCLH